jgi:hypothetical protein
MIHLSAAAIMALLDDVPLPPRFVVGCPLIDDDAVVECSLLVGNRRQTVIWFGKGAYEKLRKHATEVPSEDVFHFGVFGVLGIPIEQWKTRPDHSVLLEECIKNAIIDVRPPR